MSGEIHRIGILPLGSVVDVVPKVIAAHISGFLNLSTEILPAHKLPSKAFDAHRFQYDAGVIINEMETMVFGRCDKVVGVMSVDLFVPIFTHVFGEARQGGKVALVSLFRLEKDHDDDKTTFAILLERTAKVALHELCHLYNLSHCLDSKCLMHFSGDLEELDRTPLYFCRYCNAFFRDAVRDAGSD